MADIKDMSEAWDGHQGREVEKFLKQELAKKQAALRLGAGLERGENGVLYVVLGTEAPVTKAFGGLGLTEAGGLSLALNDPVLRLTNGGLSIGTSDTVTGEGGMLAVRFGKGLASDYNGLKVDYGTGLKLSGNKLIVDPDTLSSGGGGKKTDTTLTFASDGETLGVNIEEIAGGGLGKSSEGKLEIKLANNVFKLTEQGLNIGTSDTVTDLGGNLAVVCGKGLASDYNGLKVDYGTGLKLSGNKLEIKLANNVFKLTEYGLNIGTSETVTDLGGNLAVVYGKGLTSDANGLKVDHGAGLTTDSSGKVTVNLGGGLEINSSKIKIKYSTSVLTMGSDGMLDVDIDKLKALLGLNGPSVG